MDTATTLKSSPSNLAELGRSVFLKVWSGGPAVFEWPSTLGKRQDTFGPFTDLLNWNLWGWDSGIYIF